LSVLYALEGIRNPVLDFIFTVLTYLGEAGGFIAVGLFVYWCVNKNEGYYLLAVGGLGTVINQFLKMLFLIPRPWIIDPDFTIVESARAGAVGYSFPSGHTQCSVGLYCGIALWHKNKFLRIVCIFLCLAVPFSRLYLGVHTPADVGVSFVIASVLATGGYFLFKKAQDKPVIYVFAIVTVLILNILYICFLFFHRFLDSVYSPENIAEYNSAVKNGFTILGAALGMMASYIVGTRFIRFETKAVWWVQIIKTVGGLAVIFAVKELLKYPVNALFDADTWGTLIRYFITVFIAGAVWPMTFGFFSKIESKKNK
jgi:undecaprenyl-diphosphatase